MKTIILFFFLTCCFSSRSHAVFECGSTALQRALSVEKVNSFTFNRPGLDTSELSSSLPSEGMVTLYRGDKKGLEHFGFLSRDFMLNGESNALAEIRKSSTRTSDLLYWMNNHQKSSAESPFVSLTIDPEIAKKFAGAEGKVYVIKIDRSRVIANPLNEGEKEILALGAVFPSEIEGLPSKTNLTYPPEWTDLNSVWKLYKLHRQKDYLAQRAIIVSRKKPEIQFWHFTRSPMDLKIQAFLESQDLFALINTAHASPIFKLHFIVDGIRVDVTYLHGDTIDAVYALNF